MFFKDQINGAPARASGMRAPARHIRTPSNIVPSKVVCLEKDEALQWPQNGTQTGTTTSQRRVVEEIVQYLLQKQDSGVIVEPVPTRCKSADGQKAGVTKLPTEIHFMILGYLGDYDALCLSLACRALFNKSVPRVQNIICPLDTLGCWSAKALVRADPNNPSPTATATEAQYLDKATAAKIATPALRRNETLYMAAFPHQRLVLHSLAHNMHIPQVVRRFVSATLRDKEYENLFRPGEEYVLRNVDRREYVPFSTSKISSPAVGVQGIKEEEESIVETLHSAEMFIDAISCAPEGTVDRSKFEMGSWAGCRVDIVSKRRIEKAEDGWTRAAKGDTRRPYIGAGERRGWSYRDGSDLMTSGAWSGIGGTYRRDKSIGQRNRMYSFLGKEKFVLPCQPRLLVESRIMWV
ncbi:hypothetical protein DRE_01565 [Drechslerella stenobrocha 248]|uniref:F-box domain-containing protein n=1 Tax=Drechslerella stenobrocha 248 TaxID=1043628 RepID=W7HV06_9PEZI|nr:hypothetical protein DRE_01565 [Drechslerella stenobrocha 248]